ncbi:MAG: ADP-ribosylglycohydrolase family protein [Aureispira sp.]
MPNKTTDALLGLAIGDALGVPFEFKSALAMQQQPATTMIGQGTHQQPVGTWSDDSSLSFCLAASLIEGYNLKDIAQKFIAWKEDNYWTAWNTVFDIGRTTSRAIQELKELLLEGEEEALKTNYQYASEEQNGNGSLMRILPLVFYIQGKPLQEQFTLVQEVAALTHPPVRATMCCFFYLKLAEFLLEGKDKQAAYTQTRILIQDFWKSIPFPIEEQKHFQRFVQEDIQQLDKTDLKSGGYVIETIEASLWAFLTTTSYEAAVLTVINLGHDTDTTGAITGGLAGLYYGQENIPPIWLASLVRLDDIIELGTQLGAVYLA